MNSSFKDKIKINFDRSALTYDSVASIQKQIASDLTQLLLAEYPDFRPATAIDLGSGTGFIPLLLKQIYADTEWEINDISEQMIVQARQKLKGENYEFWSGDFEKKDIGYHDLVISSLTFQWLDNLEDTLQRLAAKCKVLAFSTLLDGTFSSWSRLFTENGINSPVASYPTYESIEKLCRDLKPRSMAITQSDYDIQFENAREFASYIKLLGVNTTKTPPNEKLKSLIASSTETINAEYRAILAVIRF